MKILIDSSVWIDYFKGGQNTLKLDSYIEQNLICVNDLILAELVPFLKLKAQFHLVELLNKVDTSPLFVDWQKIIDYQTVALRKGINKIGLPDLIILDNVIQNNLALYTLDKHFRLLKRHIHFELI
jgi:predicted nucleic acid-binding protein